MDVMVRKVKMYMASITEKRCIWMVKDWDTDEVIETRDDWKKRKDVEDFLEGMTGAKTNVFDDWVIGRRRVYIDYDWR